MTEQKNFKKIKLDKNDYQKDKDIVGLLKKVGTVLLTVAVSTRTISKASI